MLMSHCASGGLGLPLSWVSEPLPVDGENPVTHPDGVEAAFAAASTSPRVDRRGRGRERHGARLEGSAVPLSIIRVSGLGVPTSNDVSVEETRQSALRFRRRGGEAGAGQRAQRILGRVFVDFCFSG